MTTETVNVHVFLVKREWSDEWQIAASDMDPSRYLSDPCYVVETREITVDVPSREALVGVEIGGLQEAIERERAASAARVWAMEEKIGKLRALTHQPEGEA